MSRAGFDRSAHRVAAALLLAVYALLSTVGSSFVFCKGDDGHAAVEWRGSLCCAVEGAQSLVPAAADAAAALMPDLPSDCDECTDEPASQALTSPAAGAAKAPSVPSPSELPATLLAVALRAAWTPRAVIGVAVASAAPSPPPPLAMLRTVVLRC